MSVSGRSWPEGQENPFVLRQLLWLGTPPVGLQHPPSLPPLLRGPVHIPCWPSGWAQPLGSLSTPQSSREFVLNPAVMGGLWTLQAEDARECLTGGLLAKSHVYSWKKPIRDLVCLLCTVDKVALDLFTTGREASSRIKLLLWEKE